ncbi:MAG: cation-transporting P-type ATPase [Bacteroidales bacterium]
MENNQENTKWHSLEAEKVLKNLGVNTAEGLFEADIQEREQKYGKNKIPEGKKRSAWLRFFAQFHNMLIYVLIGAAIMTAFMEHWIDTGVIFGVIIINSLIGFIQEGKAEKALDGIRKMLSLNAMVMRNGKRNTVQAEDLVPGDIVILNSGDKIPADIRLIKTKDFQVEESPLTGESTAVEKDSEPVNPKSILGDRLCMAYSGTVVIYGSATGVVVATGTHTEIGKINQMMSDVENITTPLLQQIEKFGKWLAIIILGFTALFFAFGYFFRDYTITELFLASIGLIVATIPEGLPAIMTITLAIGVQSMARRNAIIRRLPSVETLGAVNVICSDKTGTLTRNEMTAKTIVTSEHNYSVEGAGYSPEGNILLDETPITPKNSKVLVHLLQSIRACNNSDISKTPEGEWALTGTPTDGALLTLSYKAGFKDFTPTLIDSIPFESAHKYKATLNNIDGKMITYMTGAPERVLDKCKYECTENGPVTINRDFWDKKIQEVAAKGQRMIGVAFREADSQQTTIEKESLDDSQVFLGLVGIIDPPRQEAIEAIKECKRAGVEVKMITGDHIITAKAIGKEIGIGDGVKAISGQELEEMSDEELVKVVNEYDVYARTSPEHKLRLVKAIQANGKLCAMTGDGVNDAPALKKANIGIAMGIKGTEVTKDASEMVLADDNFASIVNAIEEGRTVFDNIRKALLFILPTNGAEALVLVAAILLGITMPISPVQILWVNMVTAVTLALAISFEPMEENVMDLPPRKTKSSILGPLFIWRIAFVSMLIGGVTLGLFDYFKDSLLVDIEIARTVAVNTLVGGQFFYLFNCRRIKKPSIGKDFFNNKYAFYAGGTLLLLQLIFVYAPFMNTFFGTTAIDFTYWMYSLAAGITIFFVIELEKFIIGKLKKK